jgi:hypothetical protein
MEKNYRAILLTILTISLFTIAIIELLGVSKNNLFRKTHDGGQGTFYSKDGEVYHGEIYPEQTKTRDQVVAEMPKTTMQFYETKFSFGNIAEGKVVKHAFRFKNTGQNPLMIAKTDVTCGCTVTDFPRESIAPGADGEVTVEYNSAGKSGFQQKNIIVHSNALPEAVSIAIEADVK